MKLSDLYAVLEGVAPKSLSDEFCKKYNGYDNSGILLDSGDDVQKVLFCLDLTSKALDKALSIGANAVVTHHPVIYGKIADVTMTTAQGRVLQKAIRNGVSVISMHLNFDCAKRGIDHYLMCAVGGEKGKIFLPLDLEESGYGRTYDLPQTTATALAEKLKKELKTDKVLVYDQAKPITRVASFCGAGGDEEAVEAAKSAGAQAIVSSDFKHHVIVKAVEEGLSVIAPTHYAAENYGFEKIYQDIKGSLTAESVYFTDERFL